MADFTFSELTPGYIDTARALERAVYESDGRYAITLVDDQRGPLAQAAASCCVWHGSAIVAAAWLTARGVDFHLRLLVHPAHREQIPRLLAWAEDVVGTTGETITIHAEADIRESGALYTTGGYEAVFAEWVMRRDLHAPLPAETLPADCVAVPWSDASALAFYTVFVDAFSDRTGYVPLAAADWIADVADSDVFRPDLSMLARCPSGDAGYVRCAVEPAPSHWGERIGWIEQIGVCIAWRRRGIGAGLLGAAVRALAAEGLDCALLHVNENNGGAAALYRALGFMTVGRRARYVKRLRTGR